MSIIDRIARKICESQGLDWDDQASPMTSASGSDEEQDGFRQMAVAALEAMREPTIGMLTAGIRTNGHPANVWDAMLTEAMTEHTANKG